MADKHRRLLFFFSLVSLITQLKKITAIGILRNRLNNFLQNIQVEGHIARYVYPSQRKPREREIERERERAIHVKGTAHTINCAHWKTRPLHWPQRSSNSCHHKGESQIDTARVKKACGSFTDTPDLPIFLNMCKRTHTYENCTLILQTTIHAWYDNSQLLHWSPAP